MKRRQLWQGLFASIGMLTLILDGKTASNGAQTGIQICLNTVVPSLFPFFLLAMLLISSFSGGLFPSIPLLSKIMSIPQGTEFLVLSGFLGGYPVGAQCVASAFRAGILSRKQSSRMLSFCNNAGPAFLFGMVASFFPERKYAWALWGIHIVSAIFVALLFPADRTDIAEKKNQQPTSVSDALQASIRVMGTVCGWVILFRVLISFLEKWILWIFPSELRVLLIGLLELSNGCCELATIPDITIRFVICSCMLAFGGICVTFQTISVTKGIPLQHYFRGKLLQTFISFVLSWGIMNSRWFIFVIPTIPCAYVLRKKQKNSSNQTLLGV